MAGKNAVNPLMEVLGEMKKTARWRRMRSTKGEVMSVSETKSGGLKFTLDGGDVVYVLKRNANVFDSAKQVVAGDYISARGKIWLGKFLAFKLDVKEKSNKRAIEP